MLDRRLAARLPGLDLATRLLGTHRQSREDLGLMLPEMDTTADNTDDKTCANRPDIEPARVLDALMILRLCASCAQSESTCVLPSAGSITLIQTGGPSESKRLKALFRERKTELLSQISTAPLPASMSDLNLIWHAGPDASRADSARLIELIENVVLAGEPAIIFLSGTQPMTQELRSIVSAELTLPPPDTIMLAALIGQLHHCEIAPTELPGSGLEMLTEVQLVQPFCATTSAEAIGHLHRLCAPRHPVRNVTLEQVYGQPDATEAFAHLCEDLAAWQAQHLRWEDITSSFLLFGPPGTGKTRLATALAGSAQLPLVMTSYSDCQKAGHQGDMLRELNAAGARAIAQAPSVFFLDEIDSFHARGKSGSNGYILGVVNGLLTLLDRLNQTPGVIVIAATNHPDLVDAAVVRAGRFDRHIVVDLLDRAGLRAMLQAELAGGILSEVDTSALTDQLAGSTGAEIAAMLRDARTQARREKSALTAQHVKDAADRLAPRADPALSQRIAIHEAGHILAGHLFGLPMPTAAQVTSRNGFVISPKFEIETLDCFQSMIRGDLGGYAAEQVVFGSVSTGSGGTASSDLAIATRRMVEAEICYGFGEILIWQAASTNLAQLSPRQRLRIEQQLQQALMEVSQALRTHRADLERVATALLNERELDRDQIENLLRDIPRITPSPHHGRPRRSSKIRTVLS